MIGEPNMVSGYVDEHTFVFSFRYRCSGPKKKQIKEAKQIMKEINKQKIVNRRYQKQFKSYKNFKIEEMRMIKK